MATPTFKGNKSYLPSKPCAACGLEMTWRKAWANNWESVKYCSDACRRRIKLLGRRGPSGFAGELLCCAVLITSLYQPYYIGFSVPCALHFSPLAHLLGVSLA